MMTRPSALRAAVNTDPIKRNTSLIERVNVVIEQLRRVPLLIVRLISVFTLL